MVMLAKADITYKRVAMANSCSISVSKCECAVGGNSERVNADCEPETNGLGFDRQLFVLFLALILSSPPY